MISRDLLVTSSHDLLCCRQLEAVELKEEDFPFLAKHAVELKTGFWQTEKLQLLPAAAGDPVKGFTFGLNNLKELCLSITNHWYSRMLGPSKVPKVWQWMAACLDLRKLVRPFGGAVEGVSVLPSPSATVEAVNLRQLYTWLTGFNVINDLLPTYEQLLVQHVELRRRLELAATQEPYKTKWSIEIAGGGSGTTIMKQLFCEPHFYKGVEAWVFLFNHMLLKTSNEAVVESMGGIVDRHATGERHLKQPDYAKEAFIHWNGPRPHEAKALLAAALDRHFNGKRWHFQKADRGAHQGTLDRWGTNKEFKVSKVVDRLASERSRVPFMADPKKA